MQRRMNIQVRRSYKLILIRDLQTRTYTENVNHVSWYAHFLYDTMTTIQKLNGMRLLLQRLVNLKIELWKY